MLMHKVAPSLAEIQQKLISEESGDPTTCGQTSWIASDIRIQELLICLAFGFKSALFQTQVESANFQQTKTCAWTAISSVDTTHGTRCLLEHQMAHPDALELLMLTPQDLHVATLVLVLDKLEQCNTQQSWIWSYGKTSEDEGTWMDDSQKAEDGNITWVEFSPPFHAHLVKCAVVLVPCPVPQVKRVMFVFVLELLNQEGHQIFFKLRKGGRKANHAQKEKWRLAQKRSHAAK
ncbi:hypothetical protein EI94DRAFT_1698607 [Lactarius quietus]|nr:hypothetical protein EI94DRAFT_1698607 [Lactarius quietus]